MHRQLIGFFQEPEDPAQLLQSIAATVRTMASITFPVLLAAVQQSASSFTSQVFEQFLRRPINRFYMGFLVGLGACALLQAALLERGPFLSSAARWWCCSASSPWPCWCSSTR